MLARAEQPIDGALFISAHVIFVELGTQVAADGVEGGLAALRFDSVQAKTFGYEIQVFL